MANKEEEKHIIEHHFFTRFSELYFNDARISIIKSEAPDFLIDKEGKTIGVEVSQIFNQGNANQKHSPIKKYKFENDIILASQKIFETNNKIPLNVRFNFVDEFYLPKEKIFIPAKGISKIIEAQIKNLPSNKHFEFSIEEDLPKELSKISGYFSPEITQGIWYSAKSKFLSNLSQEQIKAAIIKKEKKAPAYRVLASELILLLVEGIPPYSWFDEIEKLDIKDHESCFNKIFIIRNLTNELIVVK